MLPPPRMKASIFFLRILLRDLTRRALRGLSTAPQDTVGGLRRFKKPCEASDIVS